MRKSCYLALAATVLTSCTIFDKATENIPPVKVDNSIGKRMIERPKSPRVFNGDFDLGTAGWALKYYVNAKGAFKDNIPQLTTVPTPEGKGSCLKAASISGAHLYWLAGREVYLKKGAKVDLSFRAKIKKFPGCADIKDFFIDFRNFNKHHHGMSTAERYWITGVRLKKVSEKWKTASKILTIPRDGYYFFRFVIQPKDKSKPFPDIYIDSVKLTPLNDKAKSAGIIPQIAIYENKNIPAYGIEEKINYEVKAKFFDSSKKVKKVSMDIVDDQTLEPVLSREVELVRKGNGIYEGTCSFKPNRYGSYSTRVRNDKNSALDWFGGDFSVMHPILKHDSNSIAKGIGINGEAHAPGKLTSKKFHFYATSGTLKRYFDVLRVAGIGNVRSWNFRWKFVEPEKGKFDFSQTDMIVREHKKRGIDLIGTLGLDFTKRKAIKRKRNIPDWVLPLCKMHKVSKAHSMEAFVPPFDLWENYCKALMGHYKNDIKVWEVFNEPNGWMTPKNYLEYVKAARRAADSVSPDIKIIGPCPTGDFAADRFAGWSKEFLALGGEKYIDGFAYHPYGASNDFQNGKFFEATATIDSIRSWLKNKSLPLYNTECYHFPNSLLLRTTQGDASTLLRHYLITLGKGVKSSASIAAQQIFKFRLNPHICLNMTHNMESVPGPIAAALNNLAFQLKDMTKTESLKLNKFINCYVFSGAKDEGALAVLWDLRPNGNQWTSKASASNLRFLDMWGNQINADGKGIHLGLNPVYASGKKSEIENYLQKSKFQLSAPVKITGRFFKNDLYLNAKNMSGMCFAPEVEFTSVKELNLPKSAQFAFANNPDCSVFLPGAAKGTATSAGATFDVIVKNEKIGSDKIKLLPKNPAYDLPFAGAKPLELTLPGGSIAKLVAQKDSLSITVTVKDKNIVSPKKHKPWSGDAVEVFVDTAPFASLERNLIHGGEGALPVRQYIIPAKPNAGEKQFWTSNKSPESPTVKTQKTSAGYKVNIQIPWKAIKPSGNRYGIYGIDIEVDHVKAIGGKNIKETLSGKPGQSYKIRLHYPLFSVPEQAELYSGFDALGAEKLVNGSFEKKKEKENEPKGWMNRWDRKKKVYDYGDFGYNGTKGVTVKLDTPSIKHVQGWPQKIKCNPDGKTNLLIEGFVKAENIKKAEGEKRRAGLRFFCHFYNDVKKKHMDNIGIGVNESITGSFGWKKIQCVIPVPRGATSCQLSCGLSQGVTGAVWFDDVHIKTISK